MSQSQTLRTDDFAYMQYAETNGDYEAGTIYSWTEVSRVHGVRNGICQKAGVLVSLLTDFGRINPCYPDFHGETADVIHYTGSGRRGNQKLDTANQAMLDAIASRVSVPLFNKLAVGKWQCLGYWQVTDGIYIFDENAGRMVWKFTLRKSQP